MYGYMGGRSCELDLIEPEGSDERKIRCQGNRSQSPQRRWRNQGYWRDISGQSLQRHGKSQHTHCPLAGAQWFRAQTLARIQLRQWQQHLWLGLANHVTAHYTQDRERLTALQQ